MTEIKNSGGNRALVAYLYGENVELESFDDAVFDGFGEIEVLDSGLEETTIGTPRTVAINLTSGAWARSLKIGNCSGDLLVGVYFYNAPQPPEPDPDTDPDEEPEPAPSITSLICNALQEAFPDGKVGASSFVINPDLIDFELEIE